MQHHHPPQTLDELYNRVTRLDGLNLGQISTCLSAELPDKLCHHKGQIGDLIEAYLGADAGSHARPDFTALNIELKTLPISPNGTPRESTYVCTVPLDNPSVPFHDSVVKAKLSHVLWVPIVTHKAIPLAERVIQRPFLWKPSDEEWSILETDFNELMEMITLGELNHITASLGEALHIRPKARDSRVLTAHPDETGAPSQTLPRGFYLRAGFTRGVLKNMR